eukprot:TRINITY_DN76282_c0_g1_i1.p1 TRINITY_DN76282_c0_g1~~TRINITY_DN76282_c0_g1_i1.p1  ORF type:complete len:247 (-),score=58.95 TRINITY_DN76282_c0_g1_i1:54-794(-)
MEATLRVNGMGSHAAFLTGEDTLDEIIGATYIEDGEEYEFCIKNLSIDACKRVPKRSCSSPPASLARRAAIEAEASNGQNLPVIEPNVVEEITFSQLTPVDEEKALSKAFWSDCGPTLDAESELMFDGKVVGEGHKPDGSELVEEEMVVTYMLRNVPCKVTKAEMEVELIRLGFHGTYGYVHFPTRRHGSGLGFGFVNFVSPEYAEEFKRVFDGYVFPWTRSAKRCFVVKADCQGLEANLRHFKCA